MEAMYPGSSHVATDGDGRYRLEGLPEGPLLVYAEDESGWASAVLPVSTSETTWSPVLNVTTTLSGRLCDQEGAPIQGARIIVEPTDRSWWQNANGEDLLQGRTATGSDGTFEVPRCPQSPVLVIVQGVVDYRAAGVAAEILHQNPTEPIVIKIQRDRLTCPVVMLQVVDSRGKGVPGASVSMKRDPLDPGTRGLVGAKAITADDGVAKLGRISVGTYSVRVSSGEVSATFVREVSSSDNDRPCELTPVVLEAP